jgi:glycerol-3-phosphate dehydrogenase (NAD(P)+)
MAPSCDHHLLEKVHSNDLEECPEVKLTFYYSEKDGERLVVDALAEGVKTTESAHGLGRSLGVDLPITDEVYRVLYEDKPVKLAVIDLMTRPLKHERS